MINGLKSNFYLRKRYIDIDMYRYGWMYRQNRIYIYIERKKEGREVQRGEERREQTRMHSEVIFKVYNVE